MKKYLIYITLLSAPISANAQNWDISAHGLTGIYYGFSETKEKNKYPNRWVIRGDTSLKANYNFNKQHKFGIHASTTIMFPSFSCRPWATSPTFSLLHMSSVTSPTATATKALREALMPQRYPPRQWHTSCRSTPMPCEDTISPSF